VRACLVAVPLLVANAVPPAPIEVAVSGVRSANGMVRVVACPQSQFLKDCPWSASAPARPGTVTVLLGAVPPGRYAVQAFHDENGDGRLNTNWLGIPREGVGFSNDAMAHLTIPRFAKAAFDHGTAAQKVPVTIRYFLG
jgi:uncharacterized protein (DUF2141 family)